MVPLENLTVSPETVGKTSRSWRNAVLEAIDEYEGVDTEDEEYIPPGERRLNRKFSNEFLRNLAGKTGSYVDAHRAFEQYNGSWHDLRKHAHDRQREIIQQEDGVFGLDAYELARERLVVELAGQVNCETA